MNKIILAVAALCTVNAVNPAFDDYSEMEMMTNELITKIEENLVKHKCHIADEIDHPQTHAQCEVFRNTRTQLMRRWHQAKKLKAAADKETEL